MKNNNNLNENKYLFVSKKNEFYIFSSKKKKKICAKNWKDFYAGYEKSFIVSKKDHVFSFKNKFT